MAKQGTTVAITDTFSLIIFGIFCQEATLIFLAYSKVQRIFFCLSTAISPTFPTIRNSFSIKSSSNICFSVLLTFSSSINVRIESQYVCQEYFFYNFAEKYLLCILRNALSVDISKWILRFLHRNMFSNTTSYQYYYSDFFIKKCRNYYSWRNSR